MLFLIFLRFQQIWTQNFSFGRRNNKRLIPLLRRLQLPKKVFPCFKLRIFTNLPRIFANKIGEIYALFVRFAFPTFGTLDVILKAIILFYFNPIQKSNQLFHNFVYTAGTHNEDNIPGPCLFP